MLNLTPFLFIALAATVGAILGSALIGFAVGLGIVVLANAGPA